MLNSKVEWTMYVTNTLGNVSSLHTAITATDSEVLKEYKVEPRKSALLIASGLLSAAISIWLLSVTLSAHAQEYCPSGAVVTAQSQCPGAVGPVDNLTKSILRLNNSGVNNPNETAIKAKTNNLDIGDQLENQTAAQNTTIGSFLTYENSTYGFRMQYPSGWELRSPSSIFSVGNKVVEFALVSNKPNPFGSTFLGSKLTDADLSISVENVSKFLDTNTMKVTSHNLQEYVNGKINGINSLQYPNSNTDMSLQYVRNGPTSVSGLPAWKIEYTSSIGGIPTLYETTTYVLKDNRLFTFDFDSDQLKVPETLPVAQKMIGSFQFTR